MKAINKHYKSADNLCQKWNVGQDVKIHMERVADFTAIVADAMGICNEKKVKLIYASELHDIGKALIPFDILNKPGKLSENEFQEMKKHVEHGITILRAEGIDSDVLNYIVKHHERKNGEGYPNKRDDITICDEILSICDIYDALTSDRPYRRAKRVNEAWEIINRGDFDEKLVNIFFEKIVSYHLIDESFIDKEVRDILQTDLGRQMANRLVKSSRKYNMPLSEVKISIVQK